MLFLRHPFIITFDGTATQHTHKHVLYAFFVCTSFAANGNGVPVLRGGGMSRLSPGQRGKGVVDLLCARERHGKLHREHTFAVCHNRFSELGAEMEALRVRVCVRKINTSTQKQRAQRVGLAAVRGLAKF